MRKQIAVARSMSERVCESEIERSRKKDGETEEREEDKRVSKRGISQKHDQEKDKCEEKNDVTTCCKNQDL